MLPDQVLVKAKVDGSIEALDLSTGLVRFQIRGCDAHAKWHRGRGTSPERGIEATADGHRLAFFTQALDRTYLYAIPEGTLIGQFEVTKNSLTMALSSDGHRLAMLDDDLVVVWDTDRQQRIAELPIHGESVFALEFCPGGRYLAAGAGDRRIRVWDLDSEGYPLQTLDGHSAAIGALCFSPDGALLASGDAGGEVKFWFLPEAVELITLETSEPVRKLSFSPDGNHLVELCVNKIELFHAPTPAHDAAPTALALNP